MPSPSLADFFYLAFYPLIVAGLLQFPKAVATRTEAVGFALDAVAVLFGSGMVIAYVLIFPVLRSANGDVPAALVSAALPLGDVLLVFGLVSLVIRRRSLPRDGSVAALAGALMLLLTSDFIYSYQSVTGGVNDTLQSCMGALSWILVAWAGYERLRNKDDEGPDREIEVPHLFAYLVAYVAAIAGFAVLLLAAEQHPGHAPGRHDPGGRGRDAAAAGAPGAGPARERRPARAARHAGVRGALPLPGHQLLGHHLRHRRPDRHPVLPRPRRRASWATGRQT